MKPFYHARVMLSLNRSHHFNLICATNGQRSVVDMLFLCVVCYAIISNYFNSWSCCI